MAFEPKEDVEALGTLRSYMAASRISIHGRKHVLWFSHSSFAPPTIHLLNSSPQHHTHTGRSPCVCLHSQSQYLYQLSSYATNLRIRPTTRVDVGSNPAWRRALREELRAAPVEDSVSQFGHIRRAQNRQMSAV